MDLHSDQDTIAAISTPPGQSGIGIVRLTGPEALYIAEQLFVPASPNKRPTQLPSYTTAYGWIMNNGEVVDEVILTVMRAPRTYTTQDVVEINCHGGMVPLGRVLELVLARGARLADPGEFTKRAFLFGRIDLAQAEAVLDVINARTEECQRAAMRQLQGHLSRRIAELRDWLVELQANLEAALDFGDEGLELMSSDEVELSLAGVARELEEMMQTVRLGRALREGVRAAIIGRPNVGKSSLMNALLRHERVIVTPVPGTTRDVVEDTLNLGGVPVVLADTAGVCESEDPVEALGVERTRATMRDADLVLLVLDGSEPLTAADVELLDTVPADRCLIVVNKLDLPAVLDRNALAPWADRPLVHVSARTGQGLDQLEEAMSALIRGGAVTPAESVLVTNARHADALRRGLEAVHAAQKAVKEGLSEEYVASDVREALDALGEIVGATLTEDIVNTIFERFCIGK